MNLYGHIKKYEYRLYKLKTCPNIEKLWNGSDKEHFLSEYGDNEAILSFFSKAGIYRFAFSLNEKNGNEYVDVEFCETPIAENKYFSHSKYEMKIINEAMWELEKLFKIKRKM